MKTKDYIIKIYDAWPNVSDIAGELDIPAVNVYKWRERNYIPVKYWKELVHAYNRIVPLGDSLTISDFVEEESRNLLEKSKMHNMSVPYGSLEQ